MIIIDSRTLPIEYVRANPDQPRKYFDEEKLLELAENIKRHGLLEAIGVRQVSEKDFVIVHGERRFRASKLAELPTIRVDIIETADDSEAHTLALIENLQRENLRPIEAARAVKVLIDKGLTQAAVADRLSRSRTWVAQKMRLLNLPDEVQDVVEESLTENHARQLLRLRRQDDPNKVLELATMAKEKSWTVAKLSTEVNLALVGQSGAVVVKTIYRCHFEGECEYQFKEPFIQHKTENHEAAFKIVLRDYKRRVESTGKKWALSDEQFRKLLNSNCHYCGIPPYKIHPRSTDYIYNGVDRVDSSLGYIPGNVVTCCEICNKAKRDLTTEEFLAWVDRISKHQGCFGAESCGDN